MERPAGQTNDLHVHFLVLCTGAPPLGSGFGFDSYFKGNWVEETTRPAEVLIAACTRFGR